MQTGVAEIDAAQIGAFEAGPAEIGTLEIGTLKFGAGQIDANRNGPARRDRRQFETADTICERPQILVVQNGGRTRTCVGFDPTLMDLKFDKQIGPFGHGL